MSPSFPAAPPPKSEKRNQHYVPRWWLRQFAADDGSLHALRGERTSVVGVGKIMNGDWIYNLVDEWWRPSDELEDALGPVENAASVAFQNLASAAADPEDWEVAISFIAICVCRHPETMERMHVLGKEYGLFLGTVDDFQTEADFRAAALQRFGADPGDGAYDALVAAPAEDREGAILSLIDMPPYDPRLPQTDALRAAGLIEGALTRMDRRLLRAPPGETFVFGDRPFPARDLTLGFTIPLSRSIALEFSVCKRVTPALTETQATPMEVQTVNDAQAGRAKTLIVGADATLLRGLGPVPRP